MRKIACTLLFSAITALAQVGILQSTNGIRVPSAKTNEKGMLFVSGTYFMVSDGNPLSLGGVYTNSQGESIELRESAPSNDESLFLSFAPIDNFQFGLGIPVHYDGAVKGADIDGFALGDIELNARWCFNAFENLFFGVSGAITIPTGFESRGFRPRHSWYINPDNEAFAYTADYPAINVNLHLSINVNLLLSLNAYVGVLKVYNDTRNFILWGGNMDIHPIPFLSIIAEISGETPFQVENVLHNILRSSLRLTPALRLNLPNYTYLTISGDVGLNYFLNSEDKIGTDITLKSGNKDLKYKIAGTPDISVGVSVSKMFDISWSDKDGDGVIDRKDLCPNTAQGLDVNDRGCPVDEDQDGVMNIVDLCPGTMRGLKVDLNGCPQDNDHDGVYDYQDHCLNTPPGFAVDGAGCTLDTDRDGIDDNHDKCPESRPGEKVNDEGCPLDQDRDGVPNENDQCPNTPEGLSIDEFGCPLDFDKDGVPNDYDKCPDSPAGEAVNSWGCPADEDNDGIPDSKDKCPGTPRGVGIDENGCRLDQDKDGIFDEDDKCADTPEGAPIDDLGCPVDSDGDGVDDWKDQCPGSLPNVKTDSVGCPVNSRLNFNDIAKRVRFKAKDSTLLNSSYTALNDIVAFMRQYPIALKIQSIVDSDQEDEINLAKDRMRIILEYIHKKGIATERLIIEEDITRSKETEKKGKTGVIGLTPFMLIHEEE